MPTRVVKITNATFVSADRPGVALIATGRDRLRIDQDQAYTFVRAVVDIPEGEVLTSAVLQMWMYADYSGEFTATARRSNPPEGYYRHITWNNQPTLASGSVTRNTTQDASIKLWEWDVTDDLAGRRVLDLRIVSNSSTSRWFQGIRGNRYPRLVVTTAPPSTAPDGLTPDGGAVSVASPMLQWDEHEDALGYRVQIDEADGDFSTPLYDSGEQTSTDAQHTPSYALTAGGAWVDWRVAHILPDGLSEWSDPATIRRVAKPTLTITNPGATDADPTPPIEWTASAQEAWRALVYRNGNLVDDSGRTPGADANWTPVKGAREDGQVVTREVRVWDAVERVASPGDPTYAVASIATTYTPTATVGPVDATIVTQVGETPAFEIDYTRAAGTPDEIIIKRDGEIVHRQAGTDDPWIDWGAPPNTDVRYRVVAVVNGQAADSSPSTLVRTAVTGAWVIDHPSGRWFRIGAQDLTLTYGGITETFAPIAAAELIRRTSSLRGAEGTISGRMRETAGKSVEDQVADLWWMRSRPHRTYQLLMGDLSIPVTLSDLWASFDPETSMTTRIDKVGRFDFAQTNDADALPFEAL